jgi:hypothetical protein
MNEGGPRANKIPKVSPITAVITIMSRTIFHSGRSFIKLAAGYKRTGWRRITRTSQFGAPQKGEMSGDQYSARVNP